MHLRDSQYRWGAVLIVVSASAIALALFFVFRAARTNPWRKRIGCDGLLWLALYRLRCPRPDDHVRFWLSAVAGSLGVSRTESIFVLNLLDGEYESLLCDKSLLVCIHAPLQTALESGLFGLLGDARVMLTSNSTGHSGRRTMRGWTSNLPVSSMNGASRTPGLGKR